VRAATPERRLARAAIRAYIRDNPMNWGKDLDFI
jgi:hypothetical protein